MTAGQVREVLERHVAQVELPGAVALVARGDEVSVTAVGRQSFEAATPMARDSIFRIASLSKPMTAALTMILVEEGTLRLDDSVERWLPELANRRVLRSIESELDDTVPARRAITVSDLLTCRMGFGIPMAMPGTYPIQRAVEPLELRTLGPPWPPSPHSPDEWIRHFATLPLMHQPGEQWMYNTSFHVLGVLLGRVTPNPLPTLFRERLFEPLGMVDTGFWVEAAKLARLTGFYTPRSNGTMRPTDPASAESAWARPPKFFDASGWLASTVDDVARFARMLRDGGSFQGRRILSADSVRQMTSDQLTPEQRAANQLFFGEGESWGFGMAVNLQRGPVRGYGWTGGSGTSWFTDPGTNLTGILLTQRVMTSPELPEIVTGFWNAARG